MLDVTYIYALLDPFEKQEFHIYIGKSDDPYKRYYQHLREKVILINVDGYKNYYNKLITKFTNIRSL